eukprot:XP_022279649.1 myosin heavy chain IB-like [Canis lupus familiaris]
MGRGLGSSLPLLAPEGPWLPGSLAPSIQKMPGKSVPGKEGLAPEGLLDQPFQQQELPEKLPCARDSPSSAICLPGLRGPQDALPSSGPPLGSAGSGPGTQSLPGRARERSGGPAWKSRLRSPARSQPWLFVCCFVMGRSRAGAGGRGDDVDARRTPSSRRRGMQHSGRGDPGTPAPPPGRASPRRSAKFRVGPPEGAPGRGGARRGGAGAGSPAGLRRVGPARGSDAGRAIRTRGPRPLRGAGLQKKNAPD